MKSDIRPKNNNPFQSPLPPPKRPEHPPVPTSPPDLPPLPQEQKPNKSSKKKLIISIIGIVLVLIGAVVFYLWYTNPSKAVNDAVQDAIKSKTIDARGIATIQGTEGAGKLTVTFDTKADNSTGESISNAKAEVDMSPLKINLSGAIATDSKGGSYVKLNNTKPILTNIASIAMLDETAAKPLSQLAEKIDNKWVKVSTEDLNPNAEVVVDGDGENNENSSTETAELNECSSKALKNFYDDKKQQDQVIDVYKKNQFIVIKSTGKSENIQGKDSVQYIISLDDKKITSFIKQVIKTEVGKALQECYPDTIVEQIKNMDDIEIDDSAKLSLWVSRWEHQLTRIQFATKDENSTSSLRVDTKLNENVDINLPSNAISTNELQKEIEAVMMAIFAPPQITIETED